MTLKIEDFEPVAWLVRRNAKGKRDDGMRLGLFWNKEDAKDWVCSSHTLHALYTAPPDTEELLHNLAVTTDTMRQFEALAAERLAEIEAFRAKVAALERLRELDTKQITYLFEERASKSNVIKVAKDALDH